MKQLALALSVLILALVVAGCDSTGPGKPLLSQVYDADRDTVFDAMREAFDAYYDLDEVDRKSGRINTHWDLSHAAAIFSQDGWRTKGQGRLVEKALPEDPGRVGYQAEVKVYFETNLDKDQPLDPRARSARWRKDGINPRLSQNIIDYMDTLLNEFGPSEMWEREHGGR